MISSVYIETTTKCPFNCVFCPNGTISIDRYNTDIETFKRIVGICVDNGIRHIGLTPRVGEFFYNPEYIDILSILEDNTNIDKYSVYTNFLSFTNDVFASMVNLKKADVTISINGLVYEEIQYLNNTNSIGFIDIYTRLSEFKKFDFSLGVEVKSYNLGSNDKLIRSVCSRNGMRYERQYTFGVWPDIMSNDKMVKYGFNSTPYGMCDALKRKNMIIGNGDFLLCGCRDPYGYTKVGNVFESSMIDIVSSDLYSTIPDLCSRCNGYK